MYLSEAYHLAAGDVPTEHTSLFHLTPRQYSAVVRHLDAHPFGQELPDAGYKRSWWLFNPGLGTSIVVGLDTKANGTYPMSISSDTTSTVFTGFELGQLLRDLPVDALRDDAGDVHESVDAVAVETERTWIEQHLGAGITSELSRDAVYMPVGAAREWYRYLRSMRTLAELHPSVFLPTPMLYRDRSDESVKRMVAWVIDNPAVFPPCDAVSIVEFDRMTMGGAPHGMLAPTAFTSVLPEHRCHVAGEELTYHVYDPEAWPHSNWEIDVRDIRPMETSVGGLVPPSRVVSARSCAPISSPGGR